MDRAVAVTVRRRCRTVECEGVYFIFTCDLRSHTDLDMPMLLPVKTHVVCGIAPKCTDNNDDLLWSPAGCIRIRSRLSANSECSRRCHNRISDEP